MKSHNVKRDNDAKGIPDHIDDECTHRVMRDITETNQPATYQCQRCGAMFSETEKKIVENEHMMLRRE